MNRLNRLRFAGFRRLADVDIRLRPLTVMIGANGVGKTSILDATLLLSRSAAGSLAAGLSGLGGVSSILTRGSATDLNFEASMDDLGQHPLEYALAVAPRGAGYDVAHEELSQDRGLSEPFKYMTAAHQRVQYHIKTDLVSPDWDYDATESALSQVPRTLRGPEEFRRALSAVTLYHVLNVGPRAPVKLPQPLKAALLPGPDGEDLVPLLYNLRESEPDRFEAITDALRAGFPSLESLSFPPVAAGTLAMTWKDRSFGKPIYMHELSEGTLRFLWLVALLQSPSLSTITMIDEPEVSLHPELLSLLADLMREASARTQLIVATHSDRLIRFLEPREVLVLDTGDDGFTTATWADALDLDEWLREYSLDDVWRMGRMGGRA